MHNSDKIIFPVGYHRFHKKQVFNFQLNRWYSMGYFRYEDIANIGSEITSFADWRRTMKNRAEKAAAEKRYMNAAFFYRAAEFYTFDESGEKEMLYDKFSEYFNIAFGEDSIKRIDIPYESGFLPAVKIQSTGEKQGTVLLHGGFDSFLEEWYLMMKYLANSGYEVIGFEGPGQGAALIKHELAFNIQWEKPVKAVLDHFGLDDVALFGLSMGGWLCLRAAAFEPRVRRVIANGHSIDYMKSMPYIARIIHDWLMSRKSLHDWLNRIGMKKADAENLQGWLTNQLMQITKNSNKPMDASKVWLGMNDVNIHSDKVTQDVLLLSGEKDHFVPIKMHRKQLNALVNARSVTGRIFTEKEQAQNHCQIGNLQLMLDVVIDWLHKIQVFDQRNPTADL